MNKAKENDKFKWYDRFDFVFDVIFFLPRQIMRVIKWVF